MSAEVSSKEERATALDATITAARSAAENSALAARSILVLADKKERVDWFKRIIDAATLIILGVGLYFAWDQAKKLTESIEASNRSTNISTLVALGAHSTDG
jgi:hypothetical protein